MNSLADIQRKVKQDMEAYDREHQRLFWEVCHQFSYRDIMALSRALNRTPSAIRRWKYGMSTPSRKIAYMVIDWVNRGKPMIMMKPKPRGRPAHVAITETH